MRRVLGILTLALVAGLVVAQQAGAMAGSAGTPVQVVHQAIGHPGHYAHHGYGHYGFPPRGYHHAAYPRAVRYVPVVSPPVIVRPPVYPYYYRPAPSYCPGAISIYGRGWGLSLGF